MGNIWNSVVDALWGESRHDGEFQWHDVFSGGWINAIEGRNRWPEASNNTFEIGDLTSVGGLYNAIRGQDVDNIEGAINDIFGGIAGRGEESTLGSWIGSILGTDQQGATESEIQDGTMEGVESNISSVPSWEEIYNKYWEDYDKRRKEDWARQDTAVQRQVDDMIKSGINPNLMTGSISGAESVAGNYGSNMNFASNEMELEKYLEELDIFIDEQLTTSENNKDRLNNLITTILMFFLMKK